MIPRLVSIDGSPPDLVNPPTGCAFAARCALAVEQCLDATPGLRIHSPSRRVACWRPFEAPFENIVGRRRRRRIAVRRSGGIPS